MAKTIDKHEETDFKPEPEKVKAAEKKSKKKVSSAEKSKEK